MCLSALGSLESLTPAVSIETELAMEKMKEKYEQEVQDLKIQLETKVEACYIIPTEPFSSCVNNASYLDIVRTGELLRAQHGADASEHGG